jgi:hypothetical protein
MKLPFILASLKAKTNVVPLHAMQALSGRGDIAPIHF